MDTNTPPRDRTAPAPSAPDVDYSPKTYSLREHFPILVKFLAAAGLVFLIFWIVETR